MSEFSFFILNQVIPFFKQSPTLYIGLIAGLMLYFGYLINEPQVSDQQSNTYHYIFGMGYIFAYIIFPVLLVYYLSNFIDLRIENNFLLTFFKIFVIIYVSYVLNFAKLKSHRERVSFTIFETDYVLQYLGLEYDNKFTKTEYLNKFVQNFLKLPIKKIIWILIYIIFFEYIGSLLLVLFLFIIFYSNTSIAIGLILYFDIFIAISAFATYKGINNGIYRYVEIFYKDSKETDTGRLRAIEPHYVRIHKNMKNKLISLKIIPRDVIESIELRNLEDII